MISFVILLVARTARIAWRTDRQTDRQNDKPSTVTLAAHARRGLIRMTIMAIIQYDCFYEMYGTEKIALYTVLSSSSSSHTYVHAYNGMCHRRLSCGAEWPVDTREAFLPVFLFV